MNDIFYSYFIRSNWRGRGDTAAAIGIKFLKTLDTLSSIDPIFADWRVIDCQNVSSTALAVARSRIVDIVENNVVRTEYDEPAPDEGYHSVAVAGRFKDPRSATFNVRDGGKYDCCAHLTIAEYDVAPDLAVVTYPMFKATLLAINAIWSPPWLCAYAFRSGTVSVPITIAPGVSASRIESVPLVESDPTFPQSDFHIPWIAYLSEKLSAGLKLTPEIITQRTPDGGLLMSTTTERLDPANPVHVRRARILAETMIACTRE